jgi:GT2 family glycosyltransferase
MTPGETLSTTKPSVADPPPRRPLAAVTDHPAGRQQRHRLVLPCDADRAYLAALPAALRGSWCQLTLHPAAPDDARPVDADQVAQIDILASDVVGDSIPLPPLLAGDGWRTVTFVPADAAAIRVRLIGAAAPPDAVALECRRLSQFSAALGIVRRQAPRLLGSLLRGLGSNPHGLLGRLRAELGYVGAQQTVPPFALWSRLFDEWRPADIDALRQMPDHARWPTIATLLLHGDPLDGEAPGPALAASLHHAAAALTPCGADHRAVVVIGPGDPAALERALAGLAADYVAVLQAGEILPRHALLLLAQQAASLGFPPILYADEDALSADGQRQAPRFKPPPSHELMLSGTLCTGVWLIRRDHLAGFSAGSQLWAESLRLDAWLRLHQAGAAGGAHHVPFILCHRRPDTETVPPDLLAGQVTAHLARAGLPATVVAGRPLRTRFAAPRGAQPRVSVIIPSACRAPHVVRYVSSVLERTDYADFEVVMVVSGRLPLDAEQERILAALETDKRVRRVLVETDRFNFAVANNRAIAATDSPLLCLLNDDVLPRDRGWLATMVGHLADPDIGIVGALLCYPDRTIQHGGIVLLPDGSGEHLRRFLPCPRPGNTEPPLLTQEFSAVTGACLLTSRSLWDQLNGMDEAYTSAFNDVDFCLRAREAGRGVVFAADAELIHAESISFGKHYRPDEQTRAMSDRRRLRDRFPAEFQADPFHNPNLSLRRGDCFSPAFPPRVVRPGVVRGE